MKSRSFSALAFIAWVGVLALLMWGRNYINVVYYLPIFTILKLGIINIRFVEGYTELVEVQSKPYWYIPGVMESQIFSPRYSLLSNISGGILLLLGVIIYLVLGLNIEIPGVALESREIFITNLVYVSILVGLIYTFIVGMGYLEIDMYIDRVYKSKFPIVKETKILRLSVLFYFIPLLRAYPMLDASNKCQKLNRMFKFRLHKNEGNDVLE